MRLLTKYLDAVPAITCRDGSCIGNSVPQPVVLDMLDHRLADENNPGMLDAFVQNFGNAGHDLWLRFVSDRRQGFDGHSYTWKEFVDHYGQVVGSRFWKEGTRAAPKAKVQLPSGFWAAQEPVLAADMSQISDSQQESQPAADVCQFGDSKQSVLRDHVRHTELPGCTKRRSLAPVQTGRRFKDSRVGSVPLAAQIDDRVRRARGLKKMLADELLALAALRTAEASLQVAEAGGLGAPPTIPQGLHLRSAVGLMPRAISGIDACDGVPSSTASGRIYRSRSRHRAPSAADIAAVQPIGARLISGDRFSMRGAPHPAHHGI